MRIPLAVAVVLVAACNAFDPQTGPLLNPTAAAGSDGSDYGGGGGGGGMAGAKDARCGADAGYAVSACDVCENANCCNERFGCYDDATCLAADKALDQCLAAANDAGPAVVKCWNDISSSGPRGKARVDCQRAKCKMECQVP